jgi:hypothetical protein
MPLTIIAVATFKKRCLEGKPARGVLKKYGKPWQTAILTIPRSTNFIVFPTILSDTFSRTRSTEDIGKPA